MYNSKYDLYILNCIIRNIKGLRYVGFI